MDSKLSDLHVHSYYSDGTFSPARAVECAKGVGLSCFALTDHDTTEGISEAVRAGGEDFEVLSGIELTAEMAGEEVHILGYLLDCENEPFQKMLIQMKEYRLKRVDEICGKLKKLGIPLEPADVLNLSPYGTVGRLHVAQALCEKRYVFSVQEAFAKYIGAKGGAYVGKLKLSPREAVDWIVKAGGIPVLAHPSCLSDKALIADFVEAGIMGIEAYYAEHTPFETQEYLKLAQKYNLLVTGGSDCHGLGKTEVRLGKVKLSYDFVEKLKDAKCKMTRS